MEERLRMCNYNIMEKKGGNTDEARAAEEEEKEKTEKKQKSERERERKKKFASLDVVDDKTGITSISRENLDRDD